MSDQASQQSQGEFQYPKSFEIAVSQIFVDVPHFVLGKKDYSATVMRNDDTVKLDVSFHIKDDSEDIAEVSQKIFDFIEFVNNQKLEGVTFDYDSGIMTFNDVGYIVTALQEYIDQNPDNLKKDIIDGLSDMLMKAYKDHIPELMGESAAQSAASQSRYPRSAIAFIDGIMTIKSKFEYGDDLSHYYMENLETGMVSMMITCENMDGEDFVDPDHIDALNEIESVVGAYNSDIPVKIQMEETNTRLMIHADSPMAMLNFMRECYKQIGIAGGEDIYESYDSISTAQHNYGASTTNELIGEDGEGNDVASIRNRKAISQHFGRHGSAYGLKVSDLNPDKELHLIPMQTYNSMSAVRLAQGLSLDAGVSIRSIEARVLQELGVKLPKIAKPFTYQ